MPLAVTHVLSSIILVDLYRDYITKHKKLFTVHTIFIAGIAGLLPDIDYILRIAASIANLDLPFLFQHGGFTHTPFFALLFLMPGMFLWNWKKRKQAVYFFVIAVGIMLHIFLDYLIGGGSFEGIMWLFPFSLEGWKIHLVNYLSISNIPQSLDAVILILWLWHEERRHKISDFI